MGPEEDSKWTWLDLHEEDQAFLKKIKECSDMELLVLLKYQDEDWKTIAISREWYRRNPNDPK